MNTNVTGIQQFFFMVELTYIISLWRSSMLYNSKCTVFVLCFLELICISMLSIKTHKQSCQVKKH